MGIAKIENDRQLDEYFELYKTSKNPEYIDRMIEYMDDENHKYFSVDFNDIEELSSSISSTGENLLDVLIRNYKKVSFINQFQLIKYPEVIKKLSEINDYSFAYYLDEDTLFNQIDGETVFEFLLNKGELPSNFLDYCQNHPELVEKIIAKNPKDLQYLSENALLDGTIYGMPIIDYMLENDLVTAMTLLKIPNRYEEVIAHTFAKHKEAILKFLPEEILLKTREDGKTILEYMIDNGVVFTGVYNSDDVLNILLKNGQYDAFRFLDEKELLKPAYNGKTYLENLIERNVDFTDFNHLNDPREDMTLLIMLKNKRYDLIANFELDMLTKKIEGQDVSVLDVLISRYKNGKDTKLARLKTYSLKYPESLADFYIKIGENGLIKHVRELNPALLMTESGGQRLIDILMSKNKDLTVNVLLSEATKQDFSVASYLRSKGIEQKRISVDLYYQDYVDEYLGSVVRNYQAEEVNEEQEELLNRFRELMLADGKSVPKFVEALAASYRHMMHVGNLYGERELRKLIEVKEADPSFAIKQGSGEYNKKENSIYVYNENMCVLNHETGHMLFHNFTDMQVPNEFYQMVMELRQDPEFIKRVEQYARKYDRLKMKLATAIKEEFFPLYNDSLTDEVKEDIQEFLNKSKETKKQELLKQGYSESAIETLLERTFSFDEFITQDRRIKAEQLYDAIIRTRYPGFIALGDIIDGITGGKYVSEELRNEYGNVIPPTYGHGIGYYNRNDLNQFDETIANYSQIIKSDEGEEIMGYLRDIAGERFVNFLDNYYNHEITLSSKEATKISR